MLQIGPYTIQEVITGEIRLDGGAMFGVVPRALWEKVSDVDDRNRILQYMRTLVLRSDNRIALIDTGVGHKFSPKLMDRYGVDYSKFTMENGLAKLGLTKSDITDVILTHLHFDHAGGATEYDDQGNCVSTFPNAIYYTTQKQWDWAHQPTEKDRASYFPENYDPLESEERLKRLEQPGEILPHVHGEFMDGHTQGQLQVKLGDDQSTLFHCADLIPSAAHVPIPYVMAYDLEPLTTIKMKNQLYAKALAEKWMLYFHHDPNHGLWRISETEKGIKATERVMLE